MPWLPGSTPSGLVDFEHETIEPGLGILQNLSGSFLADDPLGEGRLDFSSTTTKSASPALRLSTRPPRLTRPACRRCGRGKRPGPD